MTSFSLYSICSSYPCYMNEGLLGLAKAMCIYIYLAFTWSPAHWKIGLCFTMPTARTGISNSPNVAGIYLNLVLNPYLSAIFAEIDNTNVSWQLAYLTPTSDEQILVSNKLNPILCTLAEAFIQSTMLATDTHKSISWILAGFVLNSCLWALQYLRSVKENLLWKPTGIPSLPREWRGLTGALGSCLRMFKMFAYSLVLHLSTWIF